MDIIVCCYGDRWEFSLAFSNRQVEDGKLCFRFGRYVYVSLEDEEKDNRKKYQWEKRIPKEDDVCVRRCGSCFPKRG